MTWVTWAILSGLLLLRGLFAAMEAALQGLSDSRTRQLAKDSPRRGSRLLRLKSDPEATASALRFGMVLSGFSAAAIGALVPPRLLDVSLAAILESSSMVLLTPLASALLVALLATVVDVTFRSPAVQRPEEVALVLSGLATATVTLLYPLVRLLIAPLDLLLRPFGSKVSFQAPPAPLEDLEKQLISQAQNSEVDKGAPQLIRSIFELSDKTCRDVMVPRMEVVAMESSISHDDILRGIAEEGHSRIPVYKEDVDHIVGILHVRDLVPMLQHPELIVLQDLLRPAVYVPWMKPIGDLLRDMQRQHIHMAVVVDEYGGFSGIVTLEDILREIVGDIADEFDEEAKPFEKQADGSYLVDAAATREQFNRLFDFAFPEAEFETLGGYLCHLAGAIPEEGDRFSVHGWAFVVHGKSGPRLESVRVYKPRRADERSATSAEGLSPVAAKPSGG
jgi:putative hemolysin